ncbi:MAG: transposase [Spirochaetales bacterium]|nr:transposase [Spirochaetales bacterium]
MYSAGRRKHDHENRNDDAAFFPFTPRPVHDYPRCSGEDPLLTPSNNRAENAIRPFMVGRKNRLLAGTIAGAESSAVHHSLIESAKPANLNPYEYLMSSRVCRMGKQKMTL